jgi:hypothetical protein
LYVKVFLFLVLEQFHAFTKSHIIAKVNCIREENVVEWLNKAHDLLQAGDYHQLHATFGGSRYNKSDNNTFLANPSEWLAWYMKNIDSDVGFNGLCERVHKGLKPGNSDKCQHQM